MDFGDISDEIRRQIKAGRAAGLALAVVKNGQLVFAEGYGVTSVAEGGQPVTADTLFRIASTTKPMVGVLIMRLVERGMLDLDAPVKRYVPWLRLRDHDAAKSITLRMLMSHTTGLPTEFTANGSSDPAMLETSLREELPGYEVFTPPGLLWSYCNPGVRLAAHIAELAYGKLFPEMLRDVIFDPLEMTHSTCDPLVAMTYPLALPHRIDDGQLQVERHFPNNAARLPAGGVISTVTDLARFAQMMMSGGGWNGQQIISAESIAEMRRPIVRQYTLRDDFQALTMSSARRVGPDWIGHPGYSPPYRSRFVMHFASRSAISMLFTEGHPFVDRSWTIVKKIAQRLVPESSAAAQEFTTETVWPEFAGRYINRFGAIAKIDLTVGEPVLQFNRREYQLTRRFDDIYLASSTKPSHVVLGLPQIAGYVGRFIAIDSQPFRRVGYLQGQWRSLVARWPVLRGLS